jgi:primosomal protein N' (replication factor Y)
MKYYTIHLPLDINKELVYRSPDAIPEGARVLVNLSGKAIIGICGKECGNSIDNSIHYKQIEEVLDTAAVLPPELIKLATWMSGYYHCSIGRALFTMLPSRLQPEIDAEVAWISTEIPEKFSKLAAAINSAENMRISQLRLLLPGFPLYSRILEAETLGLLEIKHKLGHKDKPRTVNFIVVLPNREESDKLPLKQREAWELIKEHGTAFPLANISNTVSYAAVKALVKKGFIDIEARHFDPESFSFGEVQLAKQVTLNAEQLAAIRNIGIESDSFNVNLLFGITGSGKTEVYIEVIRRYLAKHKSVIILIPEIALTPQMLERFQGSFGQVLAIQHSQLTEKDRFRQWQKIKSGEIKIVLGARSAIFAPIPRLGLIIVDEEHESTYKQENSPRYQGRDLAIMRAQLSNAQVILGSATPALESWLNTQKAKYRLQTLKERPLDYQLPEVKVVDLRDEYQEDLLSPLLVEEIDKRLTRHEQVILFQNRRGYSSFMQCLKCGKLIKCSNCEISMSYHRDREEMQCHYCGSTFPSPRKCPDCGSYSFAYGAPGTQKLEQVLKIVFPTAKILRMDSDSARHRDTYTSMYNRMKKKEVDILLGTQMISKGLDFPEVTLVGIVMADISLNIPDFRAAERSFQLLTQVAGRSGRGEKNGEVIIQTYNPDHYAIVKASQQDYPGFAEQELEFRRKLNYPPYYRLARILFLCPSLELLRTEMAALGYLVQSLTQEVSDDSLLFLGPSPAPFSRISNYYRYHVIVRGVSAGVLQNAIKAIVAKLKLPSAVKIQIDVDPMSLM